MSSEKNGRLQQVIGILGGTFDPPHWGHLELAKYFCAQFNLDELILIPSGQPWQKSVQITPAPIRLQLAEAAALTLRAELATKQINTVITVDPMEIERGGPSYTIDTVQALRHVLGNELSIIWLMGADSLMQLPTWHDWQGLLHYVHLAVASRPGHPYELERNPALAEFVKAHEAHSASELEKLPKGKILLDDQFAVDLSSSVLRQKITEPDLSSGLPKNISDLIRQLGLYQSK
ncbi:nicotinate (nicotinamide) nucleotide adenylyltransferase [Polynucleobacter sp. IMCC30063]|uniref:nicotinate (nicotinamide) nucleotide adenylyltransferase n=1 Tax=unclassified Polynucleobacter TaxID=2640945 RepID=UPI001F00DAD9|nr:MULTISPECIES: nicotinate (nicotinamide) nucleotide adenylyltransferase [unclassified Polynucleobacter]MCE7506754.1 nicotinate (nicotinamide) nucleotide adenylyltransferase [Polynucleobacter sp. IMCC30063]MCE7528174.1 nicotinate (nicotinamide) nucleotide adenylyltransferase [Polynucleobacter sp. IMCC 30228]MCE7530007.1 nicotinate (nicotinamide) nucleotide adenylyltransferase [Polynucleobacter sp. IMCC 29146]